jgi:tetratricopeptide (TPR) repeat protein
MALARAETLSQGQDKTTLYNAAVDTLESYIALVPNLPGPYFVLADLHLALGAKERALEAAGRGKEAYVHNDYLTAKRAIVFYQKVEDWENAEFFLEKIITFSGTADDDALLYDLAKVKYILEKYDESVAIVKELRDRNPELVASDPAFVRAIAPYESR